MLNNILILTGGIIGTVGSLAYLIEVVKGKVKPNRVSFLLWSIAPLIAFVAQIQKGVGLESLMTFLVGFLPLLILIASFTNKQAEWKVSKFDVACGLFSFLGLVLWLITKEGNFAIALSITSDALAAIPTLVKSYKFPDTEIAWPWLAPVVGVAFTLITLQGYTFENSAFLIYIFFMNVLIFSLVQFRIGERLNGSHK